MAGGGGGATTGSAGAVAGAGVLTGAPPLSASASCSPGATGAGASRRRTLLAGLLSTVRTRPSSRTGSPGSSVATPATSAGAIQLIGATPGPGCGQLSPRRAAPLRIRRSSARVIATCMTRRSSASSAARRSASMASKSSAVTLAASSPMSRRPTRSSLTFRSGGLRLPRRPRSAMTTTGNSRPLAAWIVIRRTASRPPRSTGASGSRASASSSAVARSMKPRTSRPRRAS